MSRVTLVRFGWLALVPFLVLPLLAGAEGDKEPPGGVKKLEDAAIRVIENQPAFVGQPTRIRLEIANPNAEDLDRVTLTARLPEHLLHSSRGEELLTNLISLAPNEKVAVDLVLTPVQVGKLPIELKLVVRERTVNSKVVVTVDERTGKIKFAKPRGPAVAPAEVAFPAEETNWVASGARELLPAVPQTLLSRPRVLLPESLEQVPEIAFQEPMRGDRAKALAETRALASKILHLHNKKADSYMEELIAARTDLKGLPFVLGAACRNNPDRMRHFSNVLQAIRGSMGGDFSQPLTATVLARREANHATSDQFWQSFNQQIIPQTSAVERSRGKAKETFREAQLAALMQVCGPEQGAMRRGLTRHIGGIPHPDSSKALAKLAIFSPEDDVRREAIETLKVRKDSDYSDVLVSGLSYPWPDVAKRASDAIVQLNRHDLVPALVDALDAADPRMPRDVDVEGKKSSVVHEVVRLNHHRNCFLCHPPAQNRGKEEILTGAVPIPGEPLPSFQDGYNNSTPELAVRIDATYLRQDFSVFMKVDHARPWPEMQRFDFLVRTREVSADEAAAYRELTGAEEGVLNPYHRAAVNALRELTGRDAAPTAEAWRRVLKLPARGT